MDNADANNATGDETRAPVYDVMAEDMTLRDHIAIEASKVMLERYMRRGYFTTFFIDKEAKRRGESAEQFIARAAYTFATAMIFARRLHTVDNDQEQA